MAMGKNIVQTTLTLALTTATGMISAIAIPRLLGPEEFGKYTFVLWVTGLITMCTQLGLPDGVRKFVADLSGREQFADAHKLATQLVSAQTILTLIGSLVMVGISLSFVHDENTRLLFWLAAAYTPFSTIAAIFSDAVNGKGAIYVTSRFAGACGVIGAALALVSLVLGYKVTGLFVVMLFCNAAYCLGMFIVFKTQFKDYAGASVTHKIAAQPVAAYCFGVFSASLCLSVALDKSEMYFVKQCLGLEAAGLYVLAFNLSQKLLMLPRALSTVFIPALAQRFSKGHHDSAKSLYTNCVRLYFATIAPFSVIVAGCAEPLIRVLYGHAYLGASSAFVIAMFAAPAAAFTLPALSAVYAITGVTVKAFGCLAIPTLVDLVLAATLVPKFGITGAAFANLVTQWTLAALLVLYVERKYHFRMAKPLFIKVAICSAISGAICWSLTRVLNHSVFNTVLCGAAGTVVLPFAYKYLRVFEPAELSVASDLVLRLPPYVRWIASPVVRWFAGDVSKVASSIAQVSPSHVVPQDQKHQAETTKAETHQSASEDRVLADSVV